MGFKKKTVSIIMDAELQNKNTEKRKLKKKVLEVTGKFRRKETVIISSAIMHEINKSIKSKEKAIWTRHTKRQIRSGHNHSTTYFKYTICNMSSYELPDEE